MSEPSHSPFALVERIGRTLDEAEKHVRDKSFTYASAAIGNARELLGLLNAYGARDGERGRLREALAIIETLARNAPTPGVMTEADAIHEIAKEARRALTEGGDSDV